MKKYIEITGLIITAILGFLWYRNPTGNFEPVITVISAVINIVIHFIPAKENKQPALKETKEKTLSSMSSDEIKEFVRKSNAEDWEKTDNEDFFQVYYKNDPQLKILHDTLGDSDNIVDDFKEPWVQNFPDKQASSAYYNLWYGNTRIDRIVLVSVDGCRAKLPLPTNQQDLTIISYNYKIGKICDQLGYYDSYLVRAGILAAENIREFQR